LKICPENSFITLARATSKYNYLIKYEVDYETSESLIPGWTIKDAIIELKEISFVPGSNDELKGLHTLGLFLKEDKQYNEAFQSFSRIIESKKPDSFPDKYAESLYYRYLCQAYYERACLEDEQNSDSVNALKDIECATKIMEKEYAEAYSVHLKSIGTYSEDMVKPGTYQTYFRLQADLKYRLNDLQGALIDYKKLNTQSDIILNGRDSYSHYKEARVIIELKGDLLEALKAIDNALAICTEDDPRGLYLSQKAIILQNLKRYNDALLNINAAILFTDSAKMAYPLKLRCIIKMCLNDPKGALLDANASLLLEDDHFLYATKGLILYQSGDNQAAESSLDRAIMLSPTDGYYYYLRGNIRYKTNPKGACSDWNKSVNLGFKGSVNRLKEACN
jgi:tetratricopeptide (TPR) repeat protein